MKPTKIDVKRFDKYVEKHLLTKRPHPKGEIYIWNYTPRAQFSRQWDDVTKMARGLITDPEGNILARPFEKFFNYGEYEGQLPDEPFKVSEKMDGSLGILYTQPHNGTLALATRGSFSSDQALKGTQILWRLLDELGTKWINPAYTYLFEIIYPENRIVVDYGKEERLVLLAAINTRTGAEDLEVNYPDSVKFYNNIKKLDGLQERDNSEGYVVKFESGLRLKVKFDEYVRLHRLLTQVSSKSIWEALKNDDPLDELLDRVPDEFYKFVETTIGELQAKRLAIVDKAMEDWKGVPQNVSRKEQAEYINQQQNPALLFNFLTGKPIDEITWKMVRPKYEQPFKQDIDG